MSLVRTTNYDAIAASAPLNRDASIVRDGSGDLYDKPAPGVRVLRWIAPPALKPLSACAGAVDIVRATTGQRFGRLVALGIWAETNPKKNSVWVFRCDCGYYEGLRMKAISYLGDVTACSHCQQTERLRAMGAKPSTSKTRRKAAKGLERFARRFAP